MQVRRSLLPPCCGWLPAQSGEVGANSKLLVSLARSREETSRLALQLADAQEQLALDQELLTRARGDMQRLAGERDQAQEQVGALNKRLSEARRAQLGLEAENAALKVRQGQPLRVPSQGLMKR